MINLIVAVQSNDPKAIYAVSKLVDIVSVASGGANFLEAAIARALFYTIRRGTVDVRP